MENHTMLPFRNISAILMDDVYSTTVKDLYTNATDEIGINDSSSNALYIPLYMYITVPILNAIIFLVGTFGNVLVIVVVATVRDMRTPTNMFLLNLSAADILVLLVCQPAGLLEFFGKDRWYLGAFMCKVVPLMENGMLHVSILTMLAVTAERYNALCHPFKQRMVCKVSTTVKAIIGIWILAYGITVPFLIMTTHEPATFYDGTPVKVCRTKVDSTWRYCYMIVIFVLFFVLPFFVLVGLYSKIICQLMSNTIKRSTRNDPSALQALQSRKQVVYMLIFIIILFFISLFPIRVISLWLIFTPSSDVIKIGLEAFLNLISWARILMYVNSAGNPIIYSVTSTKFKMAFNKILRRRNTHPRGSNTSRARYFYHRSDHNQPILPLRFKSSSNRGSSDKSRSSKSSSMSRFGSGKQKHLDPNDFD